MTLEGPRRGERFEKGVCPECRRLVDCRRRDRFYMWVLEHEQPAGWARAFTLKVVGLGVPQCAGAGRLVRA